MTSAAFGIAGQFDGDDFRIGRFNRFVRRHDVRASAGTTADDTDRAVFGIQFHLRMQHGIYISNYQTDSIADSSTNVFSHSRVSCASGSGRSFHWSSGSLRLHAFFNFVHNLVN